ncbi:tRNA pseudouridine(38-40) synthase TruA [Cyanobium sp. WAJ14-Wanaka]|uniref:tRNA pseudouridine(38-40) synthase TruA n=1 Tax=Cyanobium sp. WAJ14-Wanaka TaxID=2823725 RepID=UPI0020CD073B|nr:tRNA pseudouridine(38-40) synthase TruA [Cyanobium sp. WAJ14-Wanaka]MCP9776053.1 tRNA pseudouridine(38-40) synthase TruA [Cyanobium sp. WAJ14-Wanaka]
MASLTPNFCENPQGQLQRIALCLQYDGSSYCGWQKQRNAPSVQERLEKAIAELDPHRPVHSVAAGRTDTGVHAAGQVVHFDAAGPIPPERWAKALNGRLPATIRVRSATVVKSDWHACFAANYRRYRYTIYNGRTPNLFLAPWSWHRYRRRLDERAMAEVLEEMLGEHDFSAFQRAGSRRANARTTLQEVLVERQGDLVTTELQASGFLYGMVRLVMGQLVAVGEGSLGTAAFRERWRNLRRSEIRDSAPPQGLCLLRVGYPQEIFQKAAWYDSQPRYSLECPDSPPLC